MAIVITKQNINDSTNQIFPSFLFISVKTILSKAFSMSEMDIHQILKFNYYKKLKECSIDNVDGDCFSFSLYRNTERSIILLKRWWGGIRKEEYCQVYQQCFYLEELTHIEWSISKKQNNAKAHETKIEDKVFHFGYCFEFDTYTKTRFARISFYRFSKLKNIPMIQTLKSIYNKRPKKAIKTHNFVISFSTG